MMTAWTQYVANMKGIYQKLEREGNDAANETENNEAENEARKSLPEPEITEIPIPEAHAEKETVDATALGQKRYRT